MQNGSLREEESRSYLITLSILCNKVSITSFHSRFLRDSASTHPYQNHHSNQQQSQCCVSILSVTCMLCGSNHISIVCSPAEYSLHATRILRPGNIHRLTVNRCLPSRIIYFQRKQTYTVFSGRSLINQTIRLIARPNEWQTESHISFRHTPSVFLKLRIYYSPVSVGRISFINFLIALFTYYLIHKPGITVAIRIF